MTSLNPLSFFAYGRVFESITMCNPLTISDLEILLNITPERVLLFLISLLRFLLNGRTLGVNI